MNLTHVKLPTLALVFLSAGCSMTMPQTDYKSSVTGEGTEPRIYEKFAPILASSQLQISTPNAKENSKNIMAKDGNFKGVINENFYVDKGSEALVFKMEGYKLRNELRGHKNFKTNNPDIYHHLSAELILINPHESVKNSTRKNREITVLQVHNQGTADDGSERGLNSIPHPLVRISWIEERNGIKNNYWATIKNNALNCRKTRGVYPAPECGNSYSKIDLGKASSTETTQFDIIVGGEKLIIKMNGDTKVNHSLDYWTHMLSYYKAGLYNQFKNGQSEVHFYQLQHNVQSNASTWW